MTFSENLLTAIKETSLLEWIGVMCGILYVILAAYRKMLCWFFGVISSAVYVYLCFNALLYIETGLQVFYVAMGVYGWVSWNAQRNAEIKIKMWPVKFHLIVLLVGAALAFLLGYFFEKNTQQASAYLDASIAVFSLIATFMTAHRILENWIYWIVVDFAAIFLYASRDLTLSAMLYLIFTVMALFALIQWIKQYRSQKKEPENDGAIDSLSELTL